MNVPTTWRSRKHQHRLRSYQNNWKRNQTGNTTIDLIAELKRKYPKAGSGEIVNYMVTAYCPIVAKNASLSDEEKEARLKRYSQQAEALAIQ